MEEDKKSRVSLREVARAAKVSVTAAGFALKNQPGVSAETRQHILEVARELNYFPDPRLASAMAGVRRTAVKDLLPVVWLNACQEKDAWSKYSFHLPYLEGTRERLLEHGYRLEEIWLREPGYSMNRIARIIKSKGIEGVIVTNPARHVRLDWDLLAGVAIGGGRLAPQLHRVDMDTNFNLAIALKLLRRTGYRRIGVCLAEEADRASRHSVRSTTFYFNSTIPPSCRVKPLFTHSTSTREQEKSMIATVVAWLGKEKPDAVICHTSQMLSWVEAAGFRVPEDIGVAHLAIDDDVLDWAGIHSNKREIGRLAASKLISLIQQRRFGVPSVTSSELIPGVWHPGRTICV